MNTFHAERAADILTRVRQGKPRVHCLMNTVVQKFTADGLSALGAIPSMTSSVEEVEAFVARSGALTINLGTLDMERRRAIMLAVDMAIARGKPWILDPVHCDASPSRLAFAHALLERSPTIIRANAAEMQAIGDTPHVLRIRTGASDLLKRGSETVRIDNGHPWMAAVTGTGCLSGGIIAVFMAVEKDALIAAASALLVVGVCAELAVPHSRGPGSFGINLLDALSEVTGSEIVSHARFHHEQT